MGACASRSRKKTKKCDISDEQINKFISMISPLDLICFRGNDEISGIIRKLEKFETGNGTISHVGVAMTREFCSKIKPIKTKISPQTLLCWESTMSGGLSIDGTFDAETGAGTFGTQFRILFDDIKNYIKTPGANVAVCKLINNPINKMESESESEYNNRIENLKNQIDCAYDKFNHQTYNALPLSLLGSLFPNLRPLRDLADDILGEFTNVSKLMFCSQFVAAFYETIGVITDDTDGIHDGKIPNPENIVPVDFLGAEQDTDGIVKPICMRPIWVKPEN